MISENEQRASLSIECIGGIDEAEMTIEDGVNILTGRNATNRTSTLKALMAALGSDNVSLKADAEAGNVELTMGDEMFTRRLTRTDSGIVTDGDALLDDATLADLYAFLLENNEARQAVARRDDLREIIMRPVDTEAIQQEAESLESEKRQVTEAIEELETLEQRLPQLETEKTQLEGDLEGKREELEDKETEIEKLNADVEETREEKSELDEKLDDLQTVRSSLEETRYELETEQESVKSLQSELTELTDELDGLQPTPAGEAEEIEDRIARLRRRKQSLESDVSKLQRIIQFNRELIGSDDGDILEVFAESDDREGGEDPTGQLLSQQNTVECWTCGSAVEFDQIDAMTERIQSFQSEKSSELDSISEEITEAVKKRDVLREQHETREQLEQSIKRTESEIEERNDRIEELREEREALETELSEVKEEVESLRNEDYDEVLDRHREANQLEFECDRLVDEIEDVESEIESIESRLTEREEFKNRRDDIQSQLTDLRTQVDRLEREAVEEFNARMGEVLEVLSYTNLDRVWLERTEREVREGRRKVTQSRFDLHVVRSTNNGTAYEDTIDHLSESEREVTGLVFALAGYLVHNVHEQAPFMLLDSLEAIDSERIAELIAYFECYTEYLVVALLPQDARALSDDYRRITEI